MALSLFIAVTACNPPGLERVLRACYHRATGAGHLGRILLQASMHVVQ